MNQQAYTKHLKERLSVLAGDYGLLLDPSNIKWYENKRPMRFNWARAVTERNGVTYHVLLNFKILGLPKDIPENILLAMADPIFQKMAVTTSEGALKTRKMDDLQPLDFPDSVKEYIDAHRTPGY